MSTAKRKVLSVGLHKTELREEEIAKDKEEKSDKLVAFGLIGELGFSIALPIVGGAVLGKLLDEKIGTSPKLTLSLIFLGMFFGGFSAYRALKKEFDR